MKANKYFGAKNIKTGLAALGFLLVPVVHSIAAPYPEYREKATLYESFFDFKEQYLPWWSELPEDKKGPIRQTWWRDATKNNFHDLIEVSHPDYFIALAEDGPDGRARNFGDFFPWFREPDMTKLERTYLERRKEAFLAELPADHPWADAVKSLGADIPEGAEYSRQRMAVYFNTIELHQCFRLTQQLDFVREAADLVMASPLSKEFEATGGPQLIDLINVKLGDYVEQLKQDLAAKDEPKPRPAFLREDLVKLEAGIATYLIRVHGVDELLFAQRTPARGTHWYESFGYWCDNYSENLEKWNIQKEGRLIKLDLRTLEEHTIFADKEGGVRDPCVHYDGKKILFAYRPGGEYHNHLYEINVDGTGMRQLTDGPDDDIEPIYLPDGNLVFCSSRTRRWVPCLNAQVATLHRAAGNGDNIRMLTANVETENTPWVMPDGRLLFMRWEYVERDRGFPHGLWTINPDGTGIMTFWGNMNEPDVFIDAKPIPGTNEVIFIRHPHGSGEHVGSITILNPDDGPDAKSSVRQVTPNIKLDRKKGYRDPWPIAPGVYLACQEDRLYLLNDDGQRLLLHRVPAGWVHEPRSLKAHPRPPVLPDRTDLSKGTGTVILADVTQARRFEDVERNDVDHLLLIEILPKPVHHTGHTENLSYNGNFFLERVWGNVPVEEDGSAFFEVPAMRNFFMVAMDKEGKSLKRMQSFVTLQPGEVTSCVGCHENRTETSKRITNLTALKRAPSQIEKPEGIPEIFHFPRDIQPILDKHCVECHDNDTRAGNVVLNDDLDPWFNQAYITIRCRNLIASGFGGVGNKGNLAAGSTGAKASKLYQLMEEGHEGVELSEEELRKVYYWIESWSQYSGTFAFLNKDDGIRVPVERKLLDQHCASCHGTNFHSFTANNYAPPSDADFRETFGLRMNVSNPEQSLLLRAPLAREAGGLEICRDRKAKDRTAAKQEGNWQDLDADPPARVFESKEDPVYQEMLASITAYAEKNLSLNRMEKPNPTPHHDWVREMRRNGVLDEDVNPDGKDLSFYFGIDEAYYRSFWHAPQKPES